MVQVDFHAYVLFIHKHNALRITKGNKSNKKPYFYSNTSVHIVEINVLANFYEIPLLPFQDIEKPKRRRRGKGRKVGRTDNVKPVLPQKHSLRRI